MDMRIAEKLCEITNDFYRLQSASFSSTRRNSWPGWNRCLDVLRDSGLFGGLHNADVVGNMGTPASGDSSGADPANVLVGSSASSGFAGGSVSGDPVGALASGGLAAVRSLSVLDLACGNLRFEAYLAAALDPLPVEFFAVDNCDSLAQGDQSVFGGSSSTLRYQSLDVLRALRENGRLDGLLQASSCDLSVAFGFMHHVPLPSWREEILRALIGCTRSGGYVVVSFWRFLHDEAFATKACAEHERAVLALGLPSLEAGDYVLGWKNTPGAFRYCHHFDDAELDQLVASVNDEAWEVARFQADGRTGEMNAYVILQVK